MGNYLNRIDSNNFPLYSFLFQYIITHPVYSTYLIIANQFQKAVFNDLYMDAATSYIPLKQCIYLALSRPFGLVGGCFATQYHLRGAKVHRLNISDVEVAQAIIQINFICLTQYCELLPMF